MTPEDFPLGGRIPDDAMRLLHNALDRHGLLGRTSELAGTLRSARSWMILAVVVTGATVRLMDSVVNYKSPPTIA